MIYDLLEDAILKDKLLNIFYQHDKKTRKFIYQDKKSLSKYGIDDDVDRDLIKSCINDLVDDDFLYMDVKLTGAHLEANSDVKRFLRDGGYQKLYWDEKKEIDIVELRDSRMEILDSLNIRSLRWAPVIKLRS